MRKFLLPLLLIIVAAAVYFTFTGNKDKAAKTPRQQPVAVSKYSNAFNTSIEEALNSYYALSESFVNWDSTAISKKGMALQSSVNAIAFAELSKDTLVHQTAVSYLDAFKEDLQVMSGTQDMTTKRHSFHSFSQNFYDLLRTIRYDGAPVFMQECPMAFNDTETAAWLSKSNTIRNPYLGLHHPKYKSGMLICGETKDSLNAGK